MAGYAKDVTFAEAERGVLDAESRAESSAKVRDFDRTVTGRR